jgi:hypothetical protein
MVHHKRLFASKQVLMHHFVLHGVTVAAVE